WPDMLVSSTAPAIVEIPIRLIFADIGLHITPVPLGGIPGQEKRCHAAPSSSPKSAGAAYHSRLEIETCSYSLLDQHRGGAQAKHDRRPADVVKRRSDGHEHDSVVVNQMLHNRPSG